LANLLLSFSFKQLNQQNYPHRIIQD